MVLEAYRVDMAIDRKVQTGYVLGALVLIALVGACFRIGTSYWLNILLLLFGALLGWVTGILATPLGSAEQSQFSTYAAANTTFISGFLVAKLDKLFELSVTKEALTEVLLGRALIFASAFLLGALFTFIGRRYVR
jgi:hypothetical protein